MTTAHHLRWEVEVTETYEATLDLDRLSEPLRTIFEEFGPEEWVARIEVSDQALVDEFREYLADIEVPVLLYDVIVRERRVTKTGTESLE